MKKPLEQLFQEFLYESEYVRKVRPATLQGYSQTMKTFLKLMPGITVAEITTPMITNFFKILEQRKRIVGKGIIKSGIKKSTTASYFNKLNAFFSWLTKKGLLKDNPFSAMKYPTPDYGDKKYLARKEIEKILTAIHVHHNGNVLLFKRNLVLFHLLLFCGLRKEELMHLQVRDIDIANKMIMIRADTSKSGKTRLIPLHATTIMPLVEYLKERQDYKTPYLIVSANQDEKLTYDGLRHLIDKIRRTSGVNFHLHQFRHTFAVNFLKATNNIFKLKSILGHADIRATTAYLRCMPPEEMRRDIDTLNIDNFF
jgi:site-specific recombinase XerD